MRQKLWLKYFGVKDKVMNLLKEECGETNMIAIILIIIVVIGLAVIFKGQLEKIVNGLFDAIKGDLGAFGFEE